MEQLLRDNVIFCLGIQLAFDPNNARFLLDAQEVAAGRLSMKEKPRLLVRASGLILPKIRRHLRTIVADDSEAYRLAPLEAYTPVLIDDAGWMMAGPNRGR